MPKKKTLWARDCKCLVCDEPVVNYQFMTKSQTIELDDWLLPHTKPVGDYEEFPQTLKSTICSACLMCSNEYGYGVDKNIYFTRNMARNSKVQEFYKEFVQDRFNYLLDQYDIFHEAAAKLDEQNGKPTKMRTRQTLEKVWQLGGDYPKQYFKLLFEAPRDVVTTLIASALDRYCQMARIAYEYDLEPSSWDYKTVYEGLCAHYDEHKLDMKMPQPRFFYTATNYMQSRAFLVELAETAYGGDTAPFEDLMKEYYEEAFRWFRYSFNNDDVSAIPIELKDGGLNLILARFWKETVEAQGIDLNAVSDEEDDAAEEEEGKKSPVDELKVHLRLAKRYADNALKRIANTNQQNFVNWVDNMWKEVMESGKEQEGEGEAEEGKKKKKK